MPDDFAYNFMVNITIGINPGNGGETVFSRTGTDGFAVHNNKSGAAIEFDMDWLMNLDWENLRPIRKSMCSKGLAIYPSAKDAHMGLLEARKLFQEFPDAIRITKISPGVFEIKALIP